MSSQTSSPLNVDALFLGPKFENASFFEEMIKYAVAEHLQWRAGCYPEDHASLVSSQYDAPDFKQTIRYTKEIIEELSCKLQNKSVPFFSPHYLGHVNADTLMVSGLAYVMAMMYTRITLRVKHHLAPLNWKRKPAEIFVSCSAMIKAEAGDTSHLVALWPTTRACG